MKNLFIQRHVVFIALYLYLLLANMRLTVFFLISGEIPELMVYVGIKFKLLSYLESSKSNKLYKNPWVTVYSIKKIYV